MFQSITFAIKAIYIYIYILHVSVCEPGFHALRIRQTVRKAWNSGSQTLPCNIRVAYDKFPDFFVWAFKIFAEFLRIQYVIAIHMRWLTNFYDFRFKSTATVAIGIHPAKAWFSQLVSFKNAIWHFRRMICNKSLF